MLITVLILLALLLALALWLGYRNLQHPYLQPAKSLGIKGQLQLQHRARQQLTQQAPKLRALFGFTQLAWVVGLVLILISTVQLETKLTLLIFPTGTAITSAILLISGGLLLLIPALMWPSQSYHYWAQHTDNHPKFQLSTAKEFKRYRRQSIGSVIFLDLFILIAWISRAISTSTAPILVIEYLVITVVSAIPITALITYLIQLPYLYHARYVTAKPGQSVKFGTLTYRTNRELFKQQPQLKKTFLVATIVQSAAIVSSLIALWILNSNIINPSFAVDPSAVFPAAIFALIALVIFETFGALWPTKRYHYLQQLKTDALPFMVHDNERFKQFHYHLYYLNLCAGIAWVTLWIAIVGSYYYFG